MLPHRLADELVPQELVCFVGEQDLIASGQALEARRHVGRLTQREPFTPFSGPDLAGDDQSGMDADAHSQSDVILRRQRLAELEQLVGDAKPAVDRASRVIFMRQGIAEVDQDPVAEVLGDMAVEAIDDTTDQDLIVVDHLT